MVQLLKAIHRTSTAQYRDRGQRRAIVSSLLPPAYIGLRISGTRQAFVIDIEVAYELAVHQFLRDVEREAKRIAREEGKRIGTARVRARKLVRAEIAGIYASAKESSRRRAPSMADAVRQVPEPFTVKRKKVAK